MKHVCAKKKDMNVWTTTSGRGADLCAVGGGGRGRRGVDAVEEHAAFLLLGGVAGDRALDFL